MIEISVMIATKDMNVTCAVMKSSARSVFRKANLSVNVTTVINAIAGYAMIIRVALYTMMVVKESLKFTHAVDAMSNVANVVDSKGINRDNCNAQHVSNRVWGWTRY